MRWEISKDILKRHCWKWKQVWLQDEQLCGAVDTSPVQEPQKLSEGKLTDRNEECGCDEKDADDSEEVTPAIKFHIKETFRDISWHWESSG